jgi:hypothetical protein
MRPAGSEDKYSVRGTNEKSLAWTVFAPVARSASEQFLMLRKKWSV